MVVPMAVFLTGHCRRASLESRHRRRFVIMVIAVRGRTIDCVLMVPVVVIADMMCLDPMRVRHPVRHGQAGRRETGDER